MAETKLINFRNYKTTLCSNKLCVKEKPRECCTFVAPTYEKLKWASDKNKIVSAVLRFCSVECKHEWLKNEYNKKD